MWLTRWPAAGRPHCSRAGRYWAALASGGQRLAIGQRLWAAGVVARAGLLIGLGLALGEGDSPSLVILAYYGLLFLLAVPVLGLRFPVLITSAAVAAQVLSHLARSSMSPRPVWRLRPGHRALPHRYLPGADLDDVPAGRSAIGRLDLRRGRVRVQLLVGGAGAAVTARELSGWLLDLAGGADDLQATVPQVLGNQPVERLLDAGLFGVTPTGDWRWLLVTAPHSGTTLDLVVTTGSAAAVLGGCLVLAARLPRRALVPLAAAGSMTLTLYSVHVLVLACGSVLRVENPREMWWLLVAGSLAVATLWRTRVGRGPLEAISAWLDRVSRRAVSGGASRGAGEMAARG